jgi:hypothetical protein
LRPKLVAGEVCHEGWVAAENSVFLRLGWRIRRLDRACVPGNSVKKWRIRAICGATHAAAHTDKAAIADGVCPMDGAGTPRFLFETVPKLRFWNSLK